MEVVVHTTAIKPSSENRALGKGELERMPLGHTDQSNLAYDKSETTHCNDKVSTSIVPDLMADVGHEPWRGTLKYRSPARHEGWACPSDASCNGGHRCGRWS
jgi:hypothetical protein